MVLEPIDACPICGNRQFTLHIKTSDFSYSREKFDITTCKECGLMATNPRPTPATIGLYYDSQSYISHTGGGSNLTDQIYRRVRSYATESKIKLINRYQAADKLLDYGCGTGFFLETALKSGWTPTGVEPAAEARKRIGPQIEVHSSISSVKSSFNAITLWHVLEHVHDLNQTLRELRQRMSSGGTIFIAVPNPESFDARHYKEHWAGYDVPRHLWHFTKGSMTRLLAQHDLKVSEVLPMKFDAYYVSLLSEAYRNPGSKWRNLAAAAVTGLRSNTKAGNDNYSSLIYIAGS